MLKKSLLTLAFLSLPVFLWLFSRPETQTLTTLLAPYQQAGEHTKQDLSQIASLPVHEADGVFRMEDDGQQGIQIAYANQAQAAEETTPGLSLSFPKTLDQPLEIKLDAERIITLTDQNNHDLKPELLSDRAVIPAEAGIQESWFKKLLKTLDPRVKPEDDTKSYLSYQNQRKTILYTLKKDQATNEKQLKSWTLYQSGNGIETEAYRIDHAQVKINEEGQAELFYQGDQDLKNQQAQTEVEPSLLERAQRTLEKEMGEDILNSNQSPDLIIPKPFFYDKDGERHESDWAWDQDSKTLSLELTFKDDLYPIALDPTLQFTAPATSNTGEVITGEVSSQFGNSMATGDFNNDGKMDLAVGAPAYSSSTGRVYLFYQDGAMSTTAVGADVVMTGQTAGDQFGNALAAGDLNADGRIDLVAGAVGYATNDGRAYIFYNDGSYPTAAGSADIIIGSWWADRYFAGVLITGDFNADGKTDLAADSHSYSGGWGYVHIFYNDGSWPTSTNASDVIIDSSVSSSRFGSALATGDFNADGRIDIAAGSWNYSTLIGRAYIFYNDGSWPTTAGSADVIIAGQATNNYFGYSLAAGDWNADGKTDLAVGAYGYSTNTGRAYIFYNDGSIPTTAATADVIITGETTNNYFGSAMATGDFNADGRTDLAVGAYGYSTNTGRAYIFYNDGSTTTTAATADVAITGETTSNYFSASITAGDFNADGKTDLAVGAYGYSTNTGRAYVFYSQNGQVNTNKSIAGGATGNKFGSTLAAGDINADGRTDLLVSAPNYSTDTGRIYAFYNDGSYSADTTGADVTITGEGTNQLFGGALVTGDWNADGKADIAVGAIGASGNQGRTYVFWNDGSYPSAAASADAIITGITGNDNLGIDLISGDLNADGKTDLVVGTSQYYSGSGAGFVYIFYGGSMITESASGADVTITGEASLNRFGHALGAGDLNADGKTDLIVGAYGYSSNTGRAYIFYGDGSIPTTAATADVIIAGQATNNYFGYSLAAGDFNADGRTDLVAGAYFYNFAVGRAYIFYNDGSIPTTAATADVIIDGEGDSDFGSSLASGDFNVDGKIDLAVGGYALHGSGVGRAYIFYNDGSIPTTAATADVIITGETTSDYFGSSLASGDFNADGRTDLVISAYGNTSNTGKVYFYETRENFAWQLQPTSLVPGLRVHPNFAGQELKITGEFAGNTFGSAMVVGDFNTDGKLDLAVSASAYSNTGTYHGRVYLFYSDGSVTASASSADVVITDTVGYTRFGTTLAAGDLNADSRTDLIVSTDLYDNSTAGQVKIFYNDGSYPVTSPAADVTIVGEAASNFGGSLSVGDFNADGKTDLAVGALWYNTATGSAYIFYNDGSIPTTAATADVIITGEATGNRFGDTLIAGDFNADGKMDIAIGASSYGRIYLFYNDGSIPTTAATADVAIIGSAFALAAGDFNADGRTDLAAANYSHGGYTGRVWILYNDGSWPADVASADVIISGSAGNLEFGSCLVAADMNADGRADLIAGAGAYFNSTGSVYVFYNDGSYPASNISADVTLMGAGGYFGLRLAVGDWNADGKTDLAASAYQYASSKGRVYLYNWNDGVIAGEAVGNRLGTAVATGDLNADGRTDLVVGANGYSTNTGRVYIFYNDGAYPSGAASADVIITGAATNNYFGSALKIGDLNADGKADLVVGTEATSSVYIFYNDGSYTTTAATADVIIAGSFIGMGLAISDMNADGKTDLVSNSFSYSSNGRASIFYADGTNNFGSVACSGSTPTTCVSDNADIIIDGTGGKRIESAMVGDMNADGRQDLLLGGTNNSEGTVYIFYNDGVSFGTVACTTACSAANADVLIVGENASDNFGSNIAVGDFNLDGNMDIAAGSSQYDSNNGRVYVFYQDGSWPANASGADVAIAGEGGYFGSRVVAGDMNADGRADIIAGASYMNSRTGRAYIFYNDGSLPTTAAAADIIIDGAAGYDYFSSSLAVGDMNADGKTDLIAGAEGDAGNTGWARIIMTEAKVESQAGVRARGTTTIRGSFLMKH